MLKSLEDKTFKLLAFLLPTQLSVHFFPSWSYLLGIRIDYFAPALYATDILVLSLFILSVYNRNFKADKNVPWMIFMIFIFAVINIHLSTLPQVAILKWLKFFQMVFLFLYIKNKKNLGVNSVVLPLSLSIIVIGILGVLQLVMQQSVGSLFYLLGERQISISTVGVSKITLLGKEYLRAYSTFSHPNAKAAFVLAAMPMLFTLKHTGHLKYVKHASIAMGSIAVLIAFSLSAYIAALVMGLLATTKKWVLVKVVKAGVVIGIALSVALPLFSRYMISTYSLEQSVVERLEQAEVSGQLISQNFLFGAGLNNYIHEAIKAMPGLPGTWLMQPVHNIFLLLFTESGAFGLVGSFLLICYLLSSDKTKTTRTLTLSLFVIIVTGLFDHHWLTQQQNILFFTMVAGFLAKEKTI